MNFDIPAVSSDVPAPEILLEDGPVLVVNKPAGLLTVGAKPGILTLERQIKDYLKARFQKPGNVYLGIPHRLDRPVSGVMLFARNSKAAARLAEEFRERKVQKIYWAVVEEAPQPAEGLLIDWLLKDPETAHVRVVDPATPGAREARLRYRTLESAGAGTLLEIELETGRTHQIRVQLAARGWYVLGDSQYGAQRALVLPSTEDSQPVGGAPIALHSRSLTFRHPIRYDSVTVIAPLPQNWSTLGLSPNPGEPNLGPMGAS